MNTVKKSKIWVIDMYTSYSEPYLSEKTDELTFAIICITDENLIIIKVLEV